MMHEYSIRESGRGTKISERGIGAPVERLSRHAFQIPGEPASRIDLRYSASRRQCANPCVKPELGIDEETT